MTPMLRSIPRMAKGSTGELPGGDLVLQLMGRYHGQHVAAHQQAAQQRQVAGLHRGTGRRPWRRGKLHQRFAQGRAGS
jgi:hypothetical protein